MKKEFKDINFGDEVMLRARIGGNPNNRLRIKLRVSGKQQTVREWKRQGDATIPDLVHSICGSITVGEGAFASYGVEHSGWFGDNHWEVVDD